MHQLKKHPPTSEKAFNTARHCKCLRMESENSPLLQLPQCRAKLSSQGLHTGYMEMRENPTLYILKKIDLIQYL